MSYLPVIYIAVAIIGSLLFMFLNLGSSKVEKEVDRASGGKVAVTATTSPSKPAMPVEPSGKGVLYVFLAIVSVLTIFTVYSYWDYITEHKEDLFKYVWLFAFMIFGMFASIFQENYRKGLPIANISLSKIVMPLMLSIIVFYGIYVAVKESGELFFSIYTAFINGYFWDKVVENSKKE